MSGSIASPCTWQTPPFILERVRDAFGDEIDLDPCTADDNPTGAGTFVTGPDSGGDGLKLDWAAVGFTAFINPPWSRPLGLPIDPWLEKTVAEAAKGMEIIALVPASTDTGWWRNFAPKSDAVNLLTGRVRYLDPATKKPTGTPKWGSALVYFGESTKRFIKATNDLGWIVRGI